MTEHKTQLHRRIEERKDQLLAALRQGGPDGHVRGIETALAALEAHVGGGWEHVGAVEAAHLARWLESTAPLVPDGAQVAASEGEDLRDEDDAGQGGQGNEGEGSRTADRAYRQGVQEFLAQNDPEALAAEAEEEVARDPLPYQQAEAAGRRGPQVQAP